ncbi:MAG: sugar transferase [Eubacterium sp.]|nr:sugar transferase [Eubacterium sp.]
MSFYNNKEDKRIDDNSKILDTVILRFVKLLNVLMMTGVFAFGWYKFNANTIAAPYFRRGNWAIVFIFLVLYASFVRVYDAFMVSYYRIAALVYSQTLSFIAADAVMFIVNWLLKKYVPYIPGYLLVIIMQFGVVCVWSKLTHDWYFQTFKPKKTFIVWDMRKGIDDLIDSYGLSKKFNVLGECNVKECLKNLSILDDMDAVFLSGIHSHDRNIIIKYCIDHNITSFIIPRIGDVLMSGAKRMHMFHLTILRLDRYNPPPEYFFTKRLLDIIFAAIALIICSPIMLVTAVLIKKYDKGPVFYRQCRLTKDGKKFNIIKFRSMKVDAEKDGIARLSTGDCDDRVTPIGRKIRALRIDELPQLLNILRGDMSIVGPRPERPEIAKEYEKEMPEFKLRLQAKCGLTGYAQVYGQYNSSPYDKLQMDLMYISNPSIAQDFQICLATLKILFMKDSTAGVDEGQITAYSEIESEPENRNKNQFK